jgi:hypothetical protein
MEILFPGRESPNREPSTGHLCAPAPEQIRKQE